MSRRPRVIALILVALLLALGFLGAWLYQEFGWTLIESPDEGVDVVFRFDNRSGSTAGPLTILSNATDTSRAVAPLPPGARRDVRFVDRLASGENSLVLRDSAGREYIVVGYFEAPLGGTVDVRIDAVSTTGEMSGSCRPWVSYFGSRDWTAILMR